MVEFWDYSLAAHRKRGDHYGDFLRLMIRRVIARPREITSSQELQTVLQEQRVRVTAPEAQAIWADFVNQQNLSTTTRPPLRRG